VSDPQYVVRAIKFKAIDESGFDFAGSDEPYWVFSARDPSGKVHTTRSKEFKDVDSGDQRKFDTDNGQNVVWPRKGASSGGSGSIALSVQLWEADQGDPDAIARNTQKAFELGGQAPVIGEWIRRVPKVVTDQIADFVGDDLMGSRTLHLPAARLARQLPRPGAKMTQTFRFGGKSGDLPFEVAGGPDYELTVEIARVS
jgi:hypothetical protein